eukprot:5825647-Prorocentrum_lima.AAC.1
MCIRDSPIAPTSARSHSWQERRCQCARGGKTAWDPFVPGGSLFARGACSRPCVSASRPVCLSRPAC